MSTEPVLILKGLRVRALAAVLELINRSWS